MRAYRDSTGRKRFPIQFARRYQTVAFADDFDGTTLDLSKWVIFRGDPANVTVDGQMHMAVTGTGSSGIAPANAYKPKSPYGRHQFRFKISAYEPDHGAIILLWPVAGNWPTGREYDITEFFGTLRDHISFTTHYDLNGDGTNHADTIAKVYADFITTWHDMEVEITPLAITYVMDGVVVYVDTDTRHFPTAGDASEIHMQAGTNSGVTSSANTTTMDVDYYRFYRSVPSVASFTSSNTLDSFTFDATGSHATFPEQITSYSWAFGDGTTGTGQLAQHTYTTPGTYTVTLTITDTYQDTITTTATVVAPAVSNAPQPPTSVAATSGNGTASVAWSTPADNGGSPVTSYILTLSPPAGTITYSGTNATVTGLTNGTSYTATVQAVNANGTSAASTPSAAFTPSTVPGAPTNLSFTPADGFATGTWTAPADNGGSPVTGYVVTLTPNAGTATYSGTSVIISGLTDGTSYTGVVRAVNVRGTGAASTASAAFTPVAQTTTPPASTSSSNRGRVAYGGAPKVFVAGETGVPIGSNTLTAYWTPTTADTAARATPQAMTGTGTTQQAQTAYQIQVLTAGTTTVVYDTGTVTGAAESAVVSYGGTPGSRYFVQVRVRQTDNQWSAYEGTGFVWPSGNTLYVEDFGATLDGTHNDGQDYNNYLGAGAVYFGPLRNAFKAAKAGDLVTYKAANRATVLTGLSISSAVLSSTAAVFTQAMAGQKVMVFGAGPWDATGYATLRSTVASVASDGKSLVLNNAATNPVASTSASIGYKESLVGHTDIDGNTGAGGFTFDGCGNLLFSNDPNSAGFCFNGQSNVTLQNFTFEHRNVVSRGTGQNQNSGTAFFEGTSTANRVLNVVSIHARDAAFLAFGTGVTDTHVLDCTDDHSCADAFHATGGANRIRFGRGHGYYIGDDFLPGIGYYADGLTKRPHHVWAYDMTLHGQDWGRGIALGGVTDFLYSNIVLDGTSDTPLIWGADSDQSQTERAQVIGLTVTRPNYRRGMKPTYSQGSATSSTVPDSAGMKALSTHGLTQTDVLFENVTMDSARYLQVIQYQNSSANDDYSRYNDTSIVFRGWSLTGMVNSGTSWMDDSTYSQHLDFRGITVPSGSTVRSGAVNAGSVNVGYSPHTKPGVPTGLTAVAGDTTASLSWTAPASTGGAAITGYTVTLTPTAGTITYSGTTASITGLVDGTNYSATVKASNSIGAGVATTGVSFMPSDPFVLGTTKPDATNTGLAVNNKPRTTALVDQAGNTYTPNSAGVVTLNIANAVFNAIDFNCWVVPTGADITFNDCAFYGHPTLQSGTNYAPMTNTLATGDQPTFNYCLFKPKNPKYFVNASKGGGFYNRCEFMWGVDHTNTSTGSIVAKGCYGHDHAFWDGIDPSTGQVSASFSEHSTDSVLPGWTHNDFSEIFAGTGHLYDGCNIVMNFSDDVGTPTTPQTTRPSSGWGTGYAQTFGVGSNPNNYGNGITVAARSGNVGFTLTRCWISGGNVHAQIPAQGKGFDSGNTAEISHNLVSPDVHSYNAASNTRQFFRMTSGMTANNLITGLSDTNTNRIDNTAAAISANIAGNVVPGPVNTSAQPTWQVSTGTANT